MNSVELKIEGMKCEGCVNRIKNALTNVKGLIDFNISLEEKNITITFKREKVVDEVISTVEKLGFDISR